MFHKFKLFQHNRKRKGPQLPFCIRQWGYFTILLLPSKDYLSCIGIHGDTQPIGTVNASDQIPHTPAPVGVMIIKLAAAT